MNYLLPTIVVTVLLMGIGLFMTSLLTLHTYIKLKAMEKSTHQVSYIDPVTQRMIDQPQEQEVEW